MHQRVAYVSKSDDSSDGDSPPAARELASDGEADVCDAAEATESGVPASASSAPPDAFTAGAYAALAHMTARSGSNNGGRGRARGRGRGGRGGRGEMRIRDGVQAVRADAAAATQYRLWPRSAMVTGAALGPTVASSGQTEGFVAPSEPVVSAHACDAAADADFKSEAHVKHGGATQQAVDGDHGAVPASWRVAGAHSSMSAADAPLPAPEQIVAAASAALAHATAARPPDWLDSGACHLRSQVRVDVQAAKVLFAMASGDAKDGSILSDGAGDSCVPTGAASAGQAAGGGSAPAPTAAHLPKATHVAEHTGRGEIPQQNEPLPFGAQWNFWKSPVATFSSTSRLRNAPRHGATGQANNDALWLHCVAMHNLVREPAARWAGLVQHEKCLRFEGACRQVLCAYVAKTVATACMRVGHTRRM